MNGPFQHRSQKANKAQGLLGIILILVFGVPTLVGAQEARIQDLTVANQDVPFRLVGYGLVTGLAELKPG